MASKKERVLPEDFVRMEPQDLLDMVNEALEENEEFRRGLDNEVAGI